VRAAIECPLAAMWAGAHAWHRDRMALRCLLVDDSESFLQVATVLLQREGLAVIGVASNTAEALGQARALHPDVILIDVGLGRESGFDLARLLSGDHAGSAQLIMISTRDETDYTELIAESPAAGFLAKSQLSAQGIDRVLARSSGQREAAGPASPGDKTGAGEDAGGTKCGQR
jgi:DNA-binding NarL/FixJ family response regulator